jgi:hypothetical protein
MDKISVVIPNEKKSFYKLSIFFIAVINIIGFLYFIVNNAFGSLSYVFAFLGFISILPPLCAYFIFKKNQDTHLAQIVIGILFASICWILEGLILVGVLNMVFAFMGLKTIRKLEIVFNKIGVEYPSFPKKTFHWAEVEQVILKDGMLTIDLKNNKLIQFVISNKENNLDEAQFNQRCKQLQHQISNQ